MWETNGNGNLFPVLCRQGAKGRSRKIITTKGGLNFFSSLSSFSYYLLLFFHFFFSFFFTLNMKEIKKFLL